MDCSIVPNRLHTCVAQNYQKSYHGVNTKSTRRWVNCLALNVHQYGQAQVKKSKKKSQGKYIRKIFLKTKRRITSERQRHLKDKIFNFRQLYANSAETFCTLSQAIWTIKLFSSFYVIHTARNVFVIELNKWSASFHKSSFTYCYSSYYRNQTKETSCGVCSVVWCIKNSSLQSAIQGVPLFISK